MQFLEHVCGVLFMQYLEHVCGVLFMQFLEHVCGVLFMQYLEHVCGVLFMQYLEHMVCGVLVSAKCPCSYSISSLPARSTCMREHGTVSPTVERCWR